MKIIKSLSNKFAFIEEAKDFTQFLLSTKISPIEPASQVFKVLLDNDARSFRNITDRIVQNESKAVGKVANRAQIFQEMMKCEAKINDKSCPVWKIWNSWSSCNECGVGTGNSHLKDGNPLHLLLQTYS